ncbi:MAG: DUF4412 domain-containing protein [Algoriphagus sp.]|nr:DUF4412 domain-containing protein [Algoriphagus sp.]
MKKTIVSSLLFGLLVAGFPSQAQLLKRIQNAAQNAAQSATTPKAQNEGSNPLSGMMEGMFQQAKTESSYNFSGFIVMEVTSVDKKGKADEPVQMKYLLNKDPQFMGMTFEDPKSKKTMTTTIMDSKNQAIVILIEEDGNKSSMAMKMDYGDMQEMVDKEVENQSTSQYTIQKTGNTKTILGYKCEEYLVNTEDGKGLYWVTEKPIEGVSIFSPQSNPMVSNKSIEKYQSLFTNAPKGTFLEMVFTETDGSVSKIQAIEIESNQSKTIVMSEYPNLMAGGR